MRRRFRHSIRFKLLLVSLTLLGIPWAGYQFILETERFLRDAQQQNLQSTAQSMAAVLLQHTGQFNGANLPGQANRQKNLYLNPWNQAPVVDGYADDWPLYRGSFSRYQLPGGTLKTDIAVGRHKRHAYILMRVTDPSRTYGVDGDHVDLAVARAGQLSRFSIRPLAPGWVAAKALRGQVASGDSKIRGEWQENESGYVLELRMPANLLGDRLGIAVHDSSSGDRLQTSRLQPLNQLGRLVTPSPTLQRLLQELTPHATRAWILDHEGLVLAQQGKLDTDAPLSTDQERLPWLIQKLTLAVLPHQADREFALPTGIARVDTATVREALAGRPAGMRRRIPDSDAIVVSSAVPIQTAQGVMGAVLVEQSTNAILSIQNLALQRLFGITLLLFVFTSLLLLTFASILTSRIRRLRNKLDQAVSHDGRITGEIRPERSHDEIGELAQGLAAVLTRLGEYNHYLEAMASRLAHELRTPLSVVRTSLDNAAQSQCEPEQLKYLQRAHAGAERLDLILKRLREATRLEHALQHAEPESFDLVTLLTHQVEAFSAVWPEEKIELDCEPAALPLRAAPDLVCQALEKLVSNAVDFHEPGSLIRIEATHTADSVDLSVVNTGPPLPDKLDLFRSMVSGRTVQDAQPHLGLGLYLVRLIAEFHHGQAYANNEKANGVRIGFRFPLEPAQ